MLDDVAARDARAQGDVDWALRDWTCKLESSMGAPGARVHSVAAQALQEMKKAVARGAWLEPPSSRLEPSPLPADHLHCLMHPYAVVVTTMPFSCEL